MVVFPGCDPSILQAYSTVPLDANVVAAVQKEFNAGAFAQFNDPMTKLQINDRPDLHGLTHLDIRDKLDAENLTGAFGLLDQDTAATSAVWWITTTEESKQTTVDFSEAEMPPISYPEEPFVLWKLHLWAQDLPLQWVNWDISNTDLADDISNVDPYDPHDPQIPAYTMGVNFSDPDQARSWIPDAYVTAEFSELEFSTNASLREQFLPRPPAVNRLTAAAAYEAGLLSRCIVLQLSAL